MTYPTNRPELLRRFNAGESFNFLFFWGHQPKIRQTMDHHCLSQWFAAPFEIDGVSYPTAEHFMMAEKARLFRDATTLAAILQAKDPDTVKALGRKISGFIQSEWEQQRFEIVVRGNHAKFAQNPALNDYLQSTADCILVEASPYDPIWGIGIAEQDEAVHNPNRWRGLNLLGFAIMAVRAHWCNDRPASPCAMTSTDTPSIPPPVPPKPPVPGECCERGCEMCMWDYYHEAERRYEAAVAAWQQQVGR